MDHYVADTMALILWIEKRKLPQVVKSIFNRAERGEVKIFVPAMALAELAYLAERGRIDTTLDEALSHIRRQSSMAVYPLEEATIAASFKIDDIPELHDRLIAGRRLYCNAK